VPKTCYILPSFQARLSKKMQKFRNIFATFLVVVLAVILTACQSRPQLKQVAPDAAEKPINSAEAAEQIKQKYEK